VLTKIEKVKKIGSWLREPKEEKSSEEFAWVPLDLSQEIVDKFMARRANSRTVANQRFTERMNMMGDQAFTSASSTAQRALAACLELEFDRIRERTVRERFIISGNGPDEVCYSPSEFIAAVSRTPRPAVLNSTHIQKYTGDDI